MDQFIDTNMCIGYAFKCDKWHEPANKFITNNNNTYYSDQVLEEFENKFEEIYTDIKIFMDSIPNIISQKKFYLNYQEFEYTILRNTKNCTLDKTKKIKIIELFWEKYYRCSMDNPQIMKLEFSNFNVNYFKKHDSKKDELLNILIFHNCGLNNYKKYRKYINKLKSKDVHYPDYAIVLDAHDLGLKRDVCFATTDEQFYNKIKDIDFLDVNVFKLVN